MIATSSTRSSTLARLALTPIFASASVFLAVAAVGAGSPIGALVAVPPLYLMWVWFADLVGFLRSGRDGARSLVARPFYWLWILGCAVPFVVWVTASFLNAA